MIVNYTRGDATKPIAVGNKIIVHVCNDVGGWGKGFVIALSAKWKEPEKQYREWFASGTNFQLGQVQFVQVENDLWVANTIGQRGIKVDGEGNPPVRYEAIAEALHQVAIFALKNNASIHMPRIGCGLAGGKWELIEQIVVETLSKKGIHVTVYDF